MSGIFGVGTDICEIDRIRTAWRRHGDRFAQRILGPEELEVFAHRQLRVEVRGVRYLATRFAAKEAFSKAIGQGMHPPMSWQACQILNGEKGNPVVVLNGVLADWCAQRSLQFHVSVSDGDVSAIAVVVAETCKTG